MSREFCRAPPKRNNGTTLRSRASVHDDGAHVANSYPNRSVPRSQRDAPRGLAALRAASRPQSADPAVASVARESVLRFGRHPQTVPGAISLEDHASALSGMSCAPSARSSVRGSLAAPSMPSVRVTRQLHSTPVAVMSSTRRHHHALLRVVVRIRPCAAFVRHSPRPSGALQH